SDPGIVDQDIDHPKTATSLGDDLVDRFVAGEIGLDRQQIGALLPLLSRLRALTKTVGRAVDRRDLEPLAEQAQHKCPTDTAGSASHDSRTPLLAHLLLPSSSATTLRHRAIPRKEIAPPVAPAHAAQAGRGMRSRILGEESEWRNLAA